MKEKKSQCIGKNGSPQEIDSDGGQREADILKRRTQLAAVGGEKDHVEQCRQCGRNDMRGGLAESCHRSEPNPCQCRCNDEQRLIDCS